MTRTSFDKSTELPKEILDLIADLTKTCLERNHSPPKWGSAITEVGTRLKIPAFRVSKSAYRNLIDLTLSPSEDASCIFPYLNLYTLNADGIRLPPSVMVDNVLEAIQSSLGDGRSSVETKSLEVIFGGILEVHRTVGGALIILKDVLPSTYAGRLADLLSLLYLAGGDGSDTTATLDSGSAILQVVFQSIAGILPSNRILSPQRLDDSVRDRLDTAIRKSDEMLERVTVLPDNQVYLLGLKASVALIKQGLERKQAWSESDTIRGQEGNGLKGNPCAGTAFLLNDILHCGVDGASLRLAADLKLRLLASSPDGPPGSREETVRRWVSGVLETAIKMRSSGSPPSQKGSTNSLESFAYQRIPLLLAEVAEHPLVKDHLLDLKQAVSAAVENLPKVDAPESTVEETQTQKEENTAAPTEDVNNNRNVLLGNLRKAGLLAGDISAMQTDEPADEAVVLGKLTVDATEKDIVAALELLSSPKADHSKVADALAQRIGDWTASDELLPLSTLCRIITERLSLLETVFVHLEPSRILSPLRHYVDSFQTNGHLAEDSTAIEYFGLIMLFMQNAIRFHSLASRLGHHLGSNRGFCFVWLQSTCAFHHLHELSSEDRLTLNRWLTALFGSEGISDDLTRSTNPRCLLRLAPTIVKQSLKAYEMGVIDIEGLRGGLSYFQQEILSFTLPGIIRYLVLEIRQAHDTQSTPASTMIDIVQLLLSAKTLPTGVLLLAEPEVDYLLAILPQSHVALPSLRRLPFLIVPPTITEKTETSVPTSYASQPDWSQRLRTVLNSFLYDETTTSSAPQNDHDVRIEPGLAPAILDSSIGLVGIEPVLIVLLQELVFLVASKSTSRSRIDGIDLMTEILVRPRPSFSPLRAFVSVHLHDALGRLSSLTSVLPEAALDRFESLADVAAQSLLKFRWMEKASRDTNDGGTMEVDGEEDGGNRSTVPTHRADSLADLLLTDLRVFIAEASFRKPTSTSPGIGSGSDSSEDLIPGVMGLSVLYSFVDRIKAHPGFCEAFPEFVSI